MTTMTSPEGRISDYQSRLAWAYSLYAGIFAFLFSLFIFSPLSGAGFAAIAGVSALICARLAGWIAAYFGRSTYGLVACAITAILFSMVPLLFTLYYSGMDYFPTAAPASEIMDFSVLLSLYFIFGIIYAAPAALIATFAFQLILLIARKQQWLVFQQRWL